MKWLRDLFRRSERSEEKKLASLMESLMPELRKFRANLESFECINPLVEIVQFFDIVSKWDDQRIGDLLAAFEVANRNHRYDFTIREVKVLQEHIRNVSRDQYGMSRNRIEAWWFMKNHISEMVVAIGHLDRVTVGCQGRCGLA